MSHRELKINKYQETSKIKISQKRLQKYLELEDKSR